MKKIFINKFTVIISLLLLYIFISALSYASNASADIQNSVFRLHVIANSDASYDQELKYKVRDNIIEYMKSVSSEAVSKEDYINIAYTNLEELKKVAENTVLENGYNYKVNIKIGNFKFPTKAYGDVALPSGYYDALRIEIGEAKGQNWWCVMFPPLCFVDVTSGIVPDESKENLKSNISQDEYDLITASNMGVQFKFKLIEVFQNWGLVAKK